MYWLERAGRVRVPEERYLSDVGDAFYVARYLRAWTLEMHWRGHLERTYGEDWFNRPEAGEFIISQWRLGQRRRWQQNPDDFTPRKCVLHQAKGRCE